MERQHTTNLWKPLKTLPSRITEVTIKSCTHYMYRHLRQLDPLLILQWILSANEYLKFCIPTLLQWLFQPGYSHWCIPTTKPRPPEYSLPILKIMLLLCLEQFQNKHYKQQQSLKNYNNKQQQTTTTTAPPKTLVTS